MAKRTIDFSDYEGQQYDEYQGEDPPVGKWFTAEVVRGKYDADADQMVWYLSLVDTDLYDGWTRGWYAPFDGTQKWKAQEFAKAIQGTEKPISFDPEKETEIAAIVKKAKRIKIMVGEYNDRINIRKVRPLLEKAGGPSAPKASTPAPAPEPAADVDAAVEDYTADELEGMETTELVEILKEEFQIDPPAKGRREKDDAYKTKLIETILDEQEKDGEDAPAEEGSEPADPYTEDELGEKSDEELKEILESMSVAIPAKGRRETAEAYSDKLIDAVLDAQEAANIPETDGEADPAEGEFDQGFAETAPEPEPEPTPAARRRAKAAAPAAEAPKATTTRRRRA